MSAATMNNLSTLTYPRTGKRGVPQQFPRRLYEMLESEAKLASKAPNESFVISWSESGKAFRIGDVDSFVALVLPKYFRTKKFSSFQRNLNLYGFTKVRRGPDTDMYAHPSFVRGCPDLLSELRKSTSSSRRRMIKASSLDDSDTNSEGSAARSVSPSSPTMVMNVNCFPHMVQSRLLNHVPNHVVPSPYVNNAWLTFIKPTYPQTKSIPTVNLRPKTKRDGGRLDLLALAIERESCLA